jgi:serine/threonine protein kinase
MKSVKRNNPRAEQMKNLRRQRLPASAHVPVADRLNTTEAKIKKEIAIMKKLRHPHVVRLYEVIDDRMKEKIYMSMSSFISCLRVSHCNYFSAISSRAFFLLMTSFFCSSHGVSRRRRSQVAGLQKPTGPYYFSNPKNLTRCGFGARISCVIYQMCYIPHPDLYLVFFSSTSSGYYPSRYQTREPSVDRRPSPSQD